MNIKTIIVDLDRTLLHTDKTISSYTAKILKECKKNVWLTELCTDSENELIYPNEVAFKYGSNGAEVVMSTDDGTPVLLKNKQALLINAPITKLGFECFEGREGKIVIV